MFSQAATEKFCCLSNALLEDPPISPEYLMETCFPAAMPFAEKLNYIQHFMVNESLAKLFNTDSCLPDECAKVTSAANVTYVVFLVIVLLLVVFNNLLVIVAVHRVTFLRHNIANLFIMSLAVSDLFVGLFIIPIKIQYALHNQRFCSNINICRLYLTTDTMFFSTSVTNLLVIALDRYLALNYPYKYPMWITRKRAIMIIVVTWCYGIVWGIVGNFKWHDIGGEAMVIINYTCLTNKNVYFTVVMFILVFLIPVVAMGIIYLRILMIAQHHARDIAIATCNNNQTEQSSILLLTPEPNCPYPSASPSPILRNKNHLSVRKCNVKSPSRSSSTSSHSGRIAQYRKMVFKATKTVASVYGAFVFTWLPLWCMSIVITVCKTCLQKSYTTWYYVMFVEVLPILSSMLNPCIYALMNKQYRKAFRSILKCDICSTAFSFAGRKRAQSNDSQTHHPRTKTMSAIL